MITENRVLQVIFIFGPQHILGGLSAAMRSEIRNLTCKRIVIFRQNWFKKVIFDRIRITCEAILKDSGTELHSIPQEDWERFLGDFPNWVNIDTQSIDSTELIFPHNVVTSSIEDLIGCLDNPDLICFGDAMGTIYEKNILFSKKDRILNFMLGHMRLKSYDRNILQKVKTFYLMLPIVNTRTIRIEDRVQIPTRKKVLENISIIGGSIQKEIQHFLACETDSNSAILCLENLSEANFIGYEQEIEMYVEFIDGLDERIDKVFIKSHPLDEGSKIHQIYMRSTKKVIREVPTNYNGIPIEFWPLHEYRGVVCSMSGPNLSLAYLYNMKVKNPFENLSLTKYFKDPHLGTFEFDQKVISSLLLTLPTWDEASILYPRLGEENGTISDK
jgi:hypothetical protein